MSDKPMHGKYCWCDECTNSGDVQKRKMSEAARTGIIPFDKPLHEKTIRELGNDSIIELSDVPVPVLRKWAIAVVKDKKKNESWSDVIDFLIDRFEITEEELK